MSVSKVVIFGSTGMTGSCALNSAINKGLSVRVLVRDPSKLPENHRDSGILEIHQGNVLNYQDVQKAIEGMDAVCVVLGTRNDLSPTTDLSEGMKNIIKAMEEHNVAIVSVCLSAFLFYEVDKVPPIFKELNADHQRQFDVTKGSNMKYVCILPPHIADKPRSGYTIEFDKSPGRIVSKHDLGDFLINSLDLQEYHGKVCGITSKPAN